MSLKDFDKLEEKISRMVHGLKALREENQKLKKELNAVRQDSSQRDGEKNEIKKNSQELFFKIMLTKEITEQFSIIKGCTPVRLDATKGIDKHAKMVLEGLGKANFGHPVRNITMDNDYAGAYENLCDAFWNTPTMTADEFIKELQQEYDSIF